jgi:hypothetical protein
MKQKFKILFTALFAWCCLSAEAQTTTIDVLDQVTYFDGYASLVSDPLPAGILRLRNDLITRKLTSQEIQQIGTNLRVKVTVKALCDNYDRIGDVNLVMTPKGATTYSPGTATRIEVGRFITPFMNKNVQPDTVSYNYTVNNVATILKDQSLNATYDFWVELEIFGVPYAANTQVTGCSGRNDVFKGSVKFITSGNTQSQSGTFLEPIAFKKEFNNYNANATDTLGKTTRTFQINLSQPLANPTFYLITSNHGANSGGEEYIRRLHYVFIDGALSLQYKPGSLTCEPFRLYNTQGNGIYGSTPKSNAQWQSFSNWCPGDLIPNRTIAMNSLSAGTHTFRIIVPQATFTGGQGNFPLSLYLQGSTNVLGVNEMKDETSETFLYPNPASNLLHVESSREVKQISLLNLLGQQVMTSERKDLDVSGLPAGIYLVKVQSETGEIKTLRMVKNYR